MTQPTQRPDDFDPALWELLGRHRAAEPSVGFADRTLRRLHEPPPTRRLVWRWALAGGAAAAVFAGVVWHHQAAGDRRAEFYAATQQADYLDDFDVIESLHLMKGEHHL
jgi:ferric-dicitrate binding protein FerR (iron transport regulator)